MIAETGYRLDDIDDEGESQKDQNCAKDKSQGLPPGFSLGVPWSRVELEPVFAPGRPPPPERAFCSSLRIWATLCGSIPFASSSRSNCSASLRLLPVSR